MTPKEHYEEADALVQGIEQMIKDAISSNDQQYQTAVFEAIERGRKIAQIHATMALYVEPVEVSNVVNFQTKKGSW